MAVKRILIYPDPILRKKTNEIENSDVEFQFFRDTLRDMEDTLEECDRSGAALAANQIGIMLRMFVTNQGLTMRNGMASGHRDYDPVVMSIPPNVINPVIVKCSPEQVWLDEGCLSFPGFSMKVRRHQWVRVKYETLLKINGEWKHQHLEETYQGFWAQVFQHEIDHLEGKLFVDSLPQNKRLEIVKIVGRSR